MVNSSPSRILIWEQDLVEADGGAPIFSDWKAMPGCDDVTFSVVVLDDATTGQTVTITIQSSPHLEEADAPVALTHTVDQTGALAMNAVDGNLMLDPLAGLYVFKHVRSAAVFSAPIGAGETVTLQVWANFRRVGPW